MTGAPDYARAVTSKTATPHHKSKLGQDAERTSKSDGAMHEEAAALASAAWWAPRQATAIVEKDDEPRVGLLSFISKGGSVVKGVEFAAACRLLIPSTCFRLLTAI